MEQTTNQGFGISINNQQNKTVREVMEEVKNNPHLCPECGGVLIKQGGCKVCMNCGYEVCGI